MATPAAPVCCSVIGVARHSCFFVKLEHMLENGDFLYGSDDLSQVEAFVVVEFAACVL